MKEKREGEEEEKREGEKKKYVKWSRFKSFSRFSF